MPMSLKRTWIQQWVGADKRLGLGGNARHCQHLASFIPQCPHKVPLSSGRTSRILEISLAQQRAAWVLCCLCQAQQPSIPSSKWKRLYCLEIPPTTVVPHPARASLAFLGLASPLQLVRVYGHLKSNAGAAAGQLFPSPEEWL